MDKKTLRYAWRRIRAVKTWYLLVACVVCAVLAVVALRLNFQTMVKLRADVYAADQSGVGVEQALQKLRAHVNGHMNTNLSSGPEGIYPPIHLKYTYERLVKAEQDRVNTVNSGVYTQAQTHCERLHPGSFSGGPRVPCIEDYVKQHGTSARPIPDALYKFDFASPGWSPDAAGLLLAASVVLLAAAGVRYAVGQWLD